MVIPGVSTFMHDTTLVIRDRIINNVTDPASARRSGTTSKFSVTYFSGRDIIYPVIVTQCVGYISQSLGQRSEEMNIRMTFNVDIHAMSPKQADTLVDAVYASLRSYQTGSNETIDLGLYDFTCDLISSFVEEPSGQAIEKVHRRILQVGYSFSTG